MLVYMSLLALPAGSLDPFYIDGLIVLLLLLFLYFLHPLYASQSTEGFYHSAYETFYGVVLLPAQHNKQFSHVITVDLIVNTIKEPMICMDQDIDIQLHPSLSLRPDGF